MDPLSVMYDQAKTFPLNCMDRTLPLCTLMQMSRKIDEQEEKLFDREKRACLNFIQLDDDAKGKFFAEGDE